jgi:hypothetical protein
MLPSLIVKYLPALIRFVLKNKTIYSMAKEVIKIEADVNAEKTLTKKQLHRIAFTLVGISQREFADFYCVSSQAVDQVASGLNTSKRLSQAIDDFIDASFKKSGIVFGKNTRGAGCAKNPMAVASKVKVSAPRFNS